MPWIRSAGSEHGEWNCRTRGLAGLHSEAYPEIGESINQLGFPGGSDGKVSACIVGVLGLIPGSGRSPGEGNGNPLQYSCLENPMDGGAWWASVHGVAKSRTWLSDFTFSHQPVSKRVRALGVVGVAGSAVIPISLSQYPCSQQMPTHTQHTYCSRSMETYGQWIYRVLASEAREALPWPGLFSIVIRYLFAKGPTALTWGQTEHPEFPKKLLGGWHGLWLEPVVVLLNNFYLFTYLLLSVLGLHFCVGFSLVEASRAYSLVLVGGHLIALPAFVEHRLEGDWLSSFGSWAREHRFNSCAQALLFQGIWDLPRSGIKFMLPWNSSQCYVEVWTGREFAGEWTRVCVWLSPFPVYLKHHSIVNQLYFNTKENVCVFFNFVF